MGFSLSASLNTIISTKTAKDDVRFISSPLKVRSIDNTDHNFLKFFTPLNIITCRELNLEIH